MSHSKLSTFDGGPQDQPHLSPISRYLAHLITPLSVILHDPLHNLHKQSNKFLASWKNGHSEQATKTPEASTFPDAKQARAFCSSTVKNGVICLVETDHKIQAATHGMVYDVYVWCRVLNLWNSSTLSGMMIPDDLLIFAGCCRHEPHTDLEDWNIQQHEHMSECWYQQKHGWFELSLFHFHGIQKVSPLQPMHILELGKNSQSTLEIRKPRGSWISCVFRNLLGT